LGRWPGWLQYAALVLLGLVVSLALVYVIGKIGQLHAVRVREHSVHRWVQHHRTHGLTPVLNQVTKIGTTWPDVWAGLALAAVALVVNRRFRFPLLLALAVPVEVLLQKQFHHFVTIPKPLQSTVVGPVGGFPSGGTARVLALGGLTYLALALRLRPRGRQALAVVASVAVYLEVFSRFYLGRHWIADLVGGVVFAAGVLLAVAAAERRAAGRQLATQSS
jgi:membrane-associated phospholipid phosphatase